MKKSSARFLSPACRAAIALAAGVWAASAAAGDASLSAELILEQLETAAPAPGLTRGFRPKANPDAATRICDPAVNDRLTRSTGQRGEQLTRTLYVEAAPQVDLDIAFKRGEAALLPEGANQLDSLAQALKHPRLARERFVLAGHTDSDGGADYNDRLSCERALSVRNYLRERHAIDSDRLVPMGFGYQKLKDAGNPRSEANRRVEVRRYAAAGNS